MSKLKFFVPLAFAVGFAALVAVTLQMLKISDTPQVRYANLRCYYEQTFERQGDVDVLVLGTSRLMAGIDIDALKSPQRKTIAELSRSWWGYGQMFAMIQDYLAIHSPKILITEFRVVQAERHHPFWTRNAPRSLIAKDYFSLSDAGLAKALYNYLNAFREKAEAGLRFALSEKRSTTPTNLEPIGSHDCSPNPKSTPRGLKALAKWNKRRSAWIEKDLKTYELEKETPNRDLFYARALKKLAEDHGVKIVFVAPVKSNTPALDPTVAEQFRSLMGVQLYTPPTEVLSQLHNGVGYGDPTHLNAVGRKIFTRWLVEQIEADGSEN